MSVLNYMEDKIKEKPEYIELTTEQFIEMSELLVNEKGHHGYYKGVPVKINNDYSEVKSHFAGTPLTQVLIEKLVDELKDTKFANTFLQTQLRNSNVENRKLKFENEQFKMNFINMCREIKELNDKIKG